MASNQIAFALPFLVVVITWLVCSQGKKARVGGSWTAVGFSVVVLMSIPAERGRQVESAMGEVDCAPYDAAVLSSIEEHVSPGEKILVYPYLPIIYAVTGTQPASY